MHEFGCDVGSDADVTVAAAQHQSNSSAIVAGVNRKTFRRFVNQPLCPLNVAGGFFDTDDAVDLRQAHDRVVLQVCDSASRHVVEHHGQIDCFSNGAKVLVLTFLRRFVVVGNNLQLAICTDLFGKACQLDSFSGGVRTATGHDGHTSCCLFDADSDDFAVFFDRHRGGLACGTHHTYAVRALRYVPIDQTTQCRIVDAAVFMHGRDQGHDACAYGFHVRWSVI